MSKRLALIPAVALMGALVACQPISHHCVEWDVKYKKVTIIERGKKTRTEYRSYPVCARYEEN